MAKNPLNTRERISITILPRLNLMLEKESKQTGMSKSELVERAIQSFLKKKLEEDVKFLAQVHYDDLPTENEWLMLGSSLEPYEKD